MAATASSILPGVRWNIISTEGEPKVHPSAGQMLVAGRVSRALALRYIRLMASMSL